MTSIWKHLMVLVYLFAVIVTCEETETGVSMILDFMAVFNGDYNNFADVETNGGPLVQTVASPVLIPALSKGPLFYFEEAIDRKLLRVYVAVVAVDLATDVIFVYPYTIISKFIQRPYMPYIPYSFNTYILNDFNASSFERVQDCEGSFEKKSKGVYLGGWKGCESLALKEHKKHKMEIFCEYINVECPPDSEEHFHDFLHLVRKGSRYSLFDTPAGYLHPCEKN